MENKILNLLLSGKKYREIRAALGVSQSQIFKVAEKNRDVYPRRGRGGGEVEKKMLWSFRPPHKYTYKMLQEIARRGISKTDLLNEIIRGWYE